MSYSLNSLKGDYIGGNIGDYTIGVLKGDTRSLDSSSDGKDPGLEMKAGILVWVYKGPDVMAYPEGPCTQELGIRDLGNSNDSAGFG